MDGALHWHGPPHRFQPLPPRDPVTRILYSTTNLPLLTGLYWTGLGLLSLFCGGAGRGSGESLVLVQWNTKGIFLPSGTTCM
jgi:hypothetical protein